MPHEVAPVNCEKCGTPLEEGARFCGACGARVESKPPAAAHRMVSLDAPEASASSNLIPVAREVAPLPRLSPRPAKNPALEQTMLAPAGRPSPGAPAPAPAATATRLERKSENTGS